MMSPMTFDLTGSSSGSGACRMIKKANYTGFSDSSGLPCCIPPERECHGHVAEYFHSGIHEDDSHLTPPSDLAILDLLDAASIEVSKYVRMVHISEVDENDVEIIIDSGCVHAATKFAFHGYSSSNGIKITKCKLVTRLSGFWLRYLSL